MIAHRRLAAGAAAVAAMVALPACAGPLAAVVGVPPPLHADDFSTDLARWKIEAEGEATRIEARDGQLHVLATGGATIWFRPELTEPYEIAFDVMLVDQGGAFDRVSDLNVFWAARDPAGDLLAPATTRNGRFGAYDTLTLYYVGFGGNENTTTRFRRYIGKSGDRPLLPEHDLKTPDMLNRANVWRHVTIRSEGARQTFAMDGKTVFTFDDLAPYRRGHFGFRTVRNHMIIDNFLVRGLTGRAETTP